MPKIKLLTAAAATNGAPTLATQGFPIRRTSAFDDGFRDDDDDLMLLVTGTRASGTLSGTFRLWGYSIAAAAWFPWGPGADTTKGVINAGAAISETTSNEIRHAERVSGFGDFDRIYLEVTAIGGTTPAISAWAEKR